MTDHFEHEGWMQRTRMGDWPVEIPEVTAPGREH